MKSKSLSKNTKVHAQSRNMTQEFTDSLNLPETARVHASLTKKAPRIFETKIGVSLWRQSIFCRAIAESPIVSLQIARRKITRLVSDLHDRKFVTQKHLKMKAEKRVAYDDGAN